MLRSRTIKTLTALLISMTVGAFALMILETAPVRPPSQSLAAIGPLQGQLPRLINQTAVPLQAIKWRNIVVHGSEAEDADIAQRCHFVIALDAEVRANDLWRRQLSGYHVYVPGRDLNADSIGICLMGDFTQNPPSQSQLAALTDLTIALQRALRIPADRVYLNCDLNAYSRSPGLAFPKAAFNQTLLRR